MIQINNVRQTAALNQVTENATLLVKSTADRVITKTPQERWILAVSVLQDIPAIKAKTAEIAKLTGETRGAFILAVGEASKIPTDVQRKIPHRLRATRICDARFARHNDPRERRLSIYLFFVNTSFAESTKQTKQLITKKYDIRKISKLH